MKVIGVLSCAIIATISSPAWAEPADGLRIEAIGGYDALTLGSRARHVNGAMYGARLGYDIPAGDRLAFGLDAEISGSTSEQNVLILGGPPGGVLGSPIGVPVAGGSLPPGTSLITTNAGRNIFVGGRISYSLSQKLNAFVSAGYSNLHLRSCREQAGVNSCTNSGPMPAGPLGLSPDRNIDGLRLGAGIQFAFGSRLFSTLEFRHSNYESDVSGNQVSAGLGVRF